VPVGVKASLAHIRARDLAGLVSGVLAAGLEPRSLSLELQQVPLPETLAPRDVAAIAGLRKKGIRLSLDRFGAQASVAQLRKLEVDEFLVDASFARELEREPAVQPMLLGIGDLARRLRLTCVACGVDNVQQLNFLKKGGWDQAQGLAFGEPMSGIHFAARWLARMGKGAKVAG
jgi:EAL domain-containing protein (putative c-di-GMP-specific phosphodiesterase class I)